jgi:DNA polymerase-3 subunit epsilon
MVKPYQKEEYIKQMVVDNDRKARLKQHHYRWQKIKEDWLLIGPDGWRVTEQEAEQAIQEKLLQPVLSPGAWARALVAQRPLVLDTETTGLKFETGEVIELALVEMDGSIVINTLIQCQGEIPTDASQIHGITKESLADQPTFPVVWAQLVPYLSRPLVIYNAAFDVPMLAYNALRYRKRMERPQAHCLMNAYSDYLEPGRSFLSLNTACDNFEIHPGGHRALADAQAARQVLLAMAALK